MMNLFAKTLVLLHVVLSVLGMSWAIALFWQARDFGWREPAKEVLEKSTVLHASEYDKSLAAAKEAEKIRDRTYAHVKPAIDSIRATEPSLPYNHLFYMSELKRLHEAPDTIEVRRLQKGGNFPDTPLGKPAPEDKVLEIVFVDPATGKERPWQITKSYKAYVGDLKKLRAEIDTVEGEIRKIANDTKEITKVLTGTDDANKYVQPGLYQLIDLEFKYQQQIKSEIDDIKPDWSKAIEQARLFQYRRADLEATLQKLKGPAPR